VAVVLSTTPRRDIISPEARLRVARRSKLLTVVPTVPLAARSKSGPSHVIGLRVVGISGFRAAKVARATLNSVISVTELFARDYRRTVRFSHMVLACCGRLNCRPGNQQRAENNESCL
jgi:hypothetical protein